MRNTDNSWKNICMDLIRSNLIDDATSPSGHIGLGLGCHVDTTTKVIRGILKCKTTEVINYLVKCELLTTFRRTDVWVGLDRICLTITHVLQDILDRG